MARLQNAGFPVPRGFVLTTEAWARFSSGVPEEGSPPSSWPEDFRRILAGGVSGLSLSPSETFAVRSSAVGEDARYVSFAGQFDSILGIREEQALLSAIARIWASLHAVRARAYREALGKESGREGMAVLVQVLVHARASGTLFTTHPHSGDRRRMVVEAVPGLGEGLAAGIQVGDRFELSRPLAPQAVEALRILGRHVGSKEEKWTVGEGGLVREPLWGVRALEPSLTDSQVLEIGQMGLQMEALSGGPLDVEWAVDEEGRVQVLQARPITTRPPSPEKPRILPGRRPSLYTLRFSGERWSEPVTPLSWSLLEPVLHWFVRWEDAEKKFLGGNPPTLLYRGMPYFNISLLRALVFRVPGWDPPQFLLEFLPQEEQEALRARPAYPPDFEVVGTIFRQVFAERRHERYAFNLIRNHEEWERFQPQMERRILALRLDFSRPEEGFREVFAARQLVVEYVRIHLLSLLFANIYYQVLASMLRSWGGCTDPKVLALLTTEPSGNRTVLCNKALWKLAAEADASPLLARALMESPGITRESLMNLSGGPTFDAALERFLETYGHRSSASWEIFTPRWADDPGVVLALLGAHLRGGIRADPFLDEDQALTAREEMARKMSHAIPRRSGRRFAFTRVLQLARRYMVLRENQRFAYDRLLYRLQQVLTRIGDLAVSEGRLPHPSLLPFLTVDELEGLFQESPLEQRKQVGRGEERRRQWQRDRHAWHPQFIGEGRDGDVDPPPGARLFSGLGISPGRVKGTVRVLHRLEDARKLQRGDILVARSADPGWTPLFLTAGGLIMELGSLLSHGAVVAREYALPAVVNIEGATRVFHDGQVVTLDGEKGEILLH